MLSKPSQNYPIKKPLKRLYGKDMVHKNYICELERTPSSLLERHIDAPTLKFIGGDPEMRSKKGVDAQSLKTLAKIIRSSKRMKKLSIIYKHYGILDDRAVCSLCESLQKLPGLTYLNLKFTHCENLTHSVPYGPSLDQESPKYDKL